jgi:hypothetical protein
MEAIYKRIVDSTMKRYGVPEDLRPFIYRYAKNSNVDAIRQAISFINIRRKKGEITSKYVKLPNGVSFDIEDVVHVLNQFHYGLEAMARLAREWAADRAGYEDPKISMCFSAISKSREKQARALRNLVEGLRYTTGNPTEEIVDVFGKVGALTELPDRMIATNVIIKGAYSRPFGFILYKVFYPVSSEFMRSLGKIFENDGAQDAWIDSRIRELLSNSQQARDRAIALSERLLPAIYLSIERERKFVKSIGVLNETKLMRDISIAYPLSILREMGVDVNVEEEFRNIVDKV